MNLFIKLCYVALLVFCSKVVGQYRFTYEVLFKIDSTNLANQQTEIFNLDYLAGESIFYNEAFAKLDSLITRGGSLYKANVPSPQLDILVTKDLKTKKVNFVELLGFTSYAVNDPRVLKWRIAPETKLEKDQKLQKAVTTFGGRNWIAWFNPEVNISDGPYKFHGLPGLIVSLHDENNHYVFQLVQVSSIDKLFNLKSFEKLGIRTVSLDYPQFLSLKNTYKENPEKFYIDIMNATGMTIESSEIKTIISQSAVRQKKRNNLIEL